MYCADSALPYAPKAACAKQTETLKRARWEIEADVIRGRSFDFSQRFFPEGMSRISELEFLGEQDQRLLSQIQGRTYVNMLGLFERFIGANVLGLSKNYWFSDQVALEALVQLADDALKHQALFRRIESMIASGMKTGYRFVPNPDIVARVVMASSAWAVLALTLHFELSTQVHYRYSAEPDSQLSSLYKDVLLYHWHEESEHALIDELELAREDRLLSSSQRDDAVDDLIHLLLTVDTVVQAQAHADRNYFLQICSRSLSAWETKRLGEGLVNAYRGQYISSSTQDPRFSQALSAKVTAEHCLRLQRALASLTPTGEGVKRRQALSPIQGMAQAKSRF